MALPSPVADFPDFGALVEANQARSKGLMGAAWAQLNDSFPSQRMAPGEADMRQALTAYNMNDIQGVAPTPNGQPTGQGQGQGLPGRSVVATGDDLELLAKTLQAEAGGEGLDGMLAAGSVINNRVSNGNYGQGLRGVIMKPGQFSAWNGVTGYAGGEGAIDMASLKASNEAYEAARRLVSGSYTDQTNGATHYYNPSVANPKWGERATGKPWQKIGNHVFGFADAGRS